MSSYYVYGSGWTWPDYLQARTFETSINGQISTSSREIIASNEQLHREHIEVTNNFNSTIAARIEEVSWKLSDIRDSINEVNATLSWGFSTVLISIGRIGDSLDELKRIARTPSQTWAQEQYIEARRAFEHGWHQESLTYVQRALNGYGSHTGYDLDFRSHFLLGLVLLGNAKNQMPEIINLEASEASFLTSAKYAEPDEPHEAARGMLCAGWAAYCQGHFQRSIEHTSRAVRLNQQLAEGYFQIAKILMNQDSPDQALPQLQQAINLDKNYMPKAVLDADFTKHQAKVDALFALLRDNAHKRCKQRLDKLQEMFYKIDEINNEGLTVTRYARDIMQQAILELASANNELFTNTYFGCLNADKACFMIESRLNDALQTYLSKTKVDLYLKICGLSKTEIPFGIGEKWMATFFVSGFIVFGFFAFGAISSAFISPLSKPERDMRLLGAFVDCLIGAPVVGIIGGILLATIIAPIWQIISNAIAGARLTKYNSIMKRITRFANEI